MDNIIKIFQIGLYYALIDALFALLRGVIIVVIVRKLYYRGYVGSKNNKYRLPNTILKCTRSITLSRNREGTIKTKNFRNRN